MKHMFDTLENTINKSTILDFRNYLSKYDKVTKWILSSDYCIKDKTKPNDVISFVLFPYILGLDDFQNVIKSMQKTDLKNTRSVSNEFCEFLNAGYIFSINFVIHKKSLFEKWKDKESLQGLLKQYIEMTELWQTTTPNNRQYYIKINQKLKALSNHTKSKSFNYGLFGRVIMITFLASYIKYLLIKETDVELYSWLTDRDSITQWENGIYLDLYHLISHCLCDEYIPDKELKTDELFCSMEENQIFHEDLNRVADFICGAIADYNYNDGDGSSEKHRIIIDNIISDNNYIVLIDVQDNGFARIKHIGKQ